MRTEDIALFEVHAVAVDTHLELRLKGELDLGTAHCLARALERAYEDGAGTVVVDLSGLEFIDSTGLHELVVALMRQRARGGDVLLRAPNPTTARVLEIVGLDQLFTVC